MNNVCLTGRITKNPDVRYTTNNIAVVTFSLAVNRTYKNANGEYEADFINCIAFRSSAELLAKYINKGDKLGIEGHIQTRNYDDKDGKKIYVTEIVVDRLEFLQTKKEAANNPTAKETSEPTQIEQPVENDPFKEFGKFVEIDDSELPF